MSHQPVLSVLPTTPVLSTVLLFTPATSPPETVPAAVGAAEAAVPEMVAAGSVTVPAGIISLLFALHTVQV